MPSNPQKILIIRASSIGDILLTTPLFRLLRRQFPLAETAIVIKKQFTDLVRTNPNINNVIVFDSTKGLKELGRIRREIKKQHFDVIIDIHKNFRSYYWRVFQKARIHSFKKYRIKRFLLVRFGWNFYKNIIPVYRRYIDSVKELGIQDDEQGLEFFPDKSVCESTMEILADQGFHPKNPTIALAPGAGFANKRWPGNYFATVVKKLIAEQNAKVLLLGGKDDATITQQIARECNGQVTDLAGKLDLMQTACTLAACQLIITNDTGLMHLANALKIKTVAIFGPTTKELGFFPDERISTVIENNTLTCRPCTHIGSNKCPKKHFKCMKDIRPEDVYNIVIRNLK
ncbi:MAG: lipopolysaccharide heptosyltransferase II [Calditrichaeota bacterium]|nr:lipopolysaccharide heptosyltransferase II [Calditrichota bacterium]